MFGKPIKKLYFTYNKTKTTYEKLHPAGSGVPVPQLAFFLREEGRTYYLQ